jgi:dTDP-4-dehydrorhamnose reductase
MLNILITGGNGQLGSEIREASASYPYYRFIFTDIAELDITDRDKVDDFIGENNIDVVINCAAYTNVDMAEKEPEKAMLINRDTVSNLAFACNIHDSFLVHISTDYIFDGSGNYPYGENAPTSPATSYGRSKLAGEDAMISCLPKGIIIRTSWLYSSFGHNFIKTILEKGKDKGELTVVNDQTGCPTYACDLAVLILDLIPKFLSGRNLRIYNYSNEGQCTWYEFAKEAVGLAGIKCRVNPVTSAEYQQLASRPVYSVLDKSKIKKDFGIFIPHWKESLAVCIEKLKI